MIRVFDFNICKQILIKELHFLICRIVKLNLMQIVLIRKYVTGWTGDSGVILVKLSLLFHG